MHNVLLSSKGVGKVGDRVRCSGQLCSVSVAGAGASDGETFDAEASQQKLAPKCALRYRMSTQRRSLSDLGKDLLK